MDEIRIWYGLGTDLVGVKCGLPATPKSPEGDLAAAQ